MRAIVLLLSVFFVASVASQSLPRRVIYFFGDSITAGRYPAFARGALTDSSGRSYIMEVFAKNGAQTGIVKHIMGTILDLDSIPKPTHVVIYAGVNDCVSDRPGQAARAISNIGDMLYLAKHTRILVFKIHTDNDCARTVNKWLDTVELPGRVDVLAPKIGTRVHPTRADERKMAEAVVTAILGY